MYESTLHTRVMKSAVRLAPTNVQPNRTRVVVLEVLERKVAASAHLVRYSLSSGTITGRNNVLVARRDAVASKVRLLSGRVGPAGLRVCVAGELREAALAGAGDGVRGRVEVFLLREEEDEAACLARVGLRDVEVEDGAGVRVDFAVVGRAGGLVGGGGVDGDDEVGVLVVAIQVGGAGVGGLGGLRRFRSRLRGLGCGLAGSGLRWLRSGLAGSGLGGLRRWLALLRIFRLSRLAGSGLR